MLWYILRRLLWMAVTLWVVFTVSFALMRAVPGGPLSRERQLDPAIEQLMRRRYRLDEPFWQQYRRELTAALHGDLGRSYRRPDFTTAEIIAQGFPVSASLGLVAMALALTLG
ncbi:MAG: ABC transporter, partial [Pirellulales bacterium]